MSILPKAKKYRVLIYGIEAKGLKVISGCLEMERFVLTFSTKADAPRFQEFDGVVFFQRTFETIKCATDGFRDFLQQKCDSDELDRRTNEAHVLIKEGGFVCVLLADPFFDGDSLNNFRSTDLSKRLILFSELDREDFGGRHSVDCLIDQMGRFFQIYGAACSRITPPHGNKRSKTLARVSGHTVSVVVDSNIFIIPTLLPKENQVEEYFKLLVEGISNLWERLKVEIPEWTKEFKFAGEPELIQLREELNDQLEEANGKLGEMDRLKRVLVTQGEPLVDAVIELFEKALPLTAQKRESFQEDLLLRNSSGEIVALVEVKGVGSGVTREHVNQADNHRERGQKPPTFPSLLIINTRMKTSASIEEKDRPVEAEQVRHAATNNILVLRTLDLLNLASLHRSGKISSSDVIAFLTGGASGWLKVTDTVEVVRKI